MSLDTKRRRPGGVLKVVDAMFWIRLLFKGDMVGSLPLSTTPTCMMMTLCWGMVEEQGVC